MDYHKVKFAISLKAIVLDAKGNLLIIRRSKDDYTRPNGWDIPGGGLNENEDPRQGIQREIKEETGLDVTNIEILDTIPITLKDGCAAIMLVFKGLTDSSDITLSHEHDQFKWLSKEEVKSLDLPEIYKKFMEKI